MKWSLNELKKFQNQVIDFNESLDLQKNIQSRNSEVIDLSQVEVVGSLEINQIDYVLSYLATYTITLPSSRSLEPVKMKEKITVLEVFMTAEQYQSAEILDDENVLVLEKDLIDLDESVSDNILLNIPIQVLTEAEQEGDGFVSGNDWEIMSEETYQNRLTREKKEKNSPFSHLNDLFKEKNE
ncbi:MULTISPECIES: DUF177 domain-containing protein [unclassified Enterococcus]|uniref:YceD family protein n=1 Tax=unclassified Enterococcus TaxID=2608891 RepID=UPI0015523019|nr:MULTISPECIES: DUF177 domain-containing protein [unclassified Enterococcus]MBS7578221.1 DUF177 domain-containing protein [Enterococcus sp. MMGLQ5-2]MBS7585403.1 DUF177 domain-containing protein [Enterococcus sp. MMGLQ5-1]NPD13260.1 DUF177 domain-containing protein [Enterococcus sp. MMGLQ5-1]NPD38052.1 DUF177 domain-containing protein [Enterococcus sp. MMGLQ5-2]